MKIVCHDEFQLELTPEEKESIIGYFEKSTNPTTPNTWELKPEYYVEEPWLLFFCWGIHGSILVCYSIPSNYPSLCYDLKWMFGENEEVDQLILELQMASL